MKGIHLITNGKSTKKELAQLRTMHHYFDYIHVREKSKTAAELMQILDFLAGIGIPLSKVIINDRVDLAVMKGCTGVQLAYNSLPVTLVKKQFPDLKIGKSVHSIEEAWKAEKDGADFILYGHIYHSKSKQGVKPRGIQALQRVAKSISIPTIAVGGIHPEQVEEVLGAGAKGLAMISAFWESPAPLQAAKAYYERFNHWEEEHFERTL
ncbi:thiamine phosphate synthase [Gracilibacillus xinjiangensis]|uniref:Thiamine phosphate synthase n=1 Tax=Gracilibacillus xinjiangensis TaxID=1193282 RepID=A0ABV8WTU6_9BACI